MKACAFLALFAVGCSVPDVSFYPDDATAADAASTDAGLADTALDAAVDELADSAAYCTADGPSPPPGTKCCALDAAAGVLCSGACNVAACSMCTGCFLPNLCCAKGGKGTCASQCQ